MKICVSIGETTAAAVLQGLEASTDADLFEVRFDYLPLSERNELVRLFSENEVRSKIVATLRPVAEGGRAELSREERIAFFHLINGYYACDLEEDIAHISPDTRIKMVSFHDHSGVPNDFEHIFERLASHCPDVVKIACSVEDATEAIPLWNLLRRGRESGVGVLPIAMGEAGKWTRILGPAFGAPIAYAACDNETATAPGQFSFTESAERYRIREITPKTAVFGVVGDPVSSSLSPAMHNAAFAANGDDAVFVPFQVKDIEVFFRGMVRGESREVEMNFGGFAVTMPHKLAVMPLLDDIDDAAREIGAVNTVEFAGGKLIGHNTDAAGFLAPLLSRYGELAGMRFAVIGAGGAARACVHAIQRSGAETVVFARDAAKAVADLGSFDIKFELFDEDTSFERYDVVVNATPVGMNGEKLLSAYQILGVRCVYDLITKETPFVADAFAAGIEVITGREMLLEQGILQYEAWMKKPAPREAMQRALDEVS
ncbi:MAG: type I 3-dehydroquinate dehydratase [Acidobacteria bacterium]|nr:type I 3-dehydroquinate dehydratase [Acidobacteriota bacterium]